MRPRWVIVLSVLLCLTWAHAEEPQGTLLLPCPGNGPSQCTPSKKDAKAARKNFEKGLKLQKNKHLQEAFDSFESAARLAPQNVDYVTAREMTRQQLVFDHLQSGNQQLLENRRVEALGEFRAALHLDPENQFAQQRMQEAYSEWAPRMQEQTRVIAAAGPAEVVPKPEKKEFHFRGDSRMLLTQVAQSFGIAATVDDTVPSRKVRFDIDAVDFYTAMRAACDVTRAFWTPLNEKQILVALDSTDNRRQYEQMAMRTFYVPGISAPQELTDLVNLLRNLFEVRFITPQPRSSTLTLRAPQRILEAATQFLQGLNSSRPQVMLDIKVYQISHTVARDMGVQIPNQFQLYNIPAGALAALGGQNIQDLINQLIANGGINQASSTALSGLLSQLQGQQNSIFSQPLATFGGGLTFM
jgi:general secretion pathway protein D